MNAELVSTLCFFLTFLPVNSIVTSVCVCTKPKTRGLVDLSDPKYCGTINATYPKLGNRIADYRIFSKSQNTLTWKGFVCSEWIHTKKITGSFWIGSFDIVFSHKTKQVEPSECWKIINNKKCGGNSVISTGTTYSFQQEPVGEGKWYSTREYQVLNCLAQQVTLKQETQNGPIISPFGYHNISILEGKIINNHNTIVWRSSEIVNGNGEKRNCGTKVILEGKGQISVTLIKDSRTETGRLVDDSKQIEILFHHSETQLCGEIRHAHAVIGLPETHIALGHALSDYMIRKKKPAERHRREIHTDFSKFLSDVELNKNKKRFGTAFAYGKIQQLTGETLVLTTHGVDRSVYLDNKMDDQNPAQAMSNLTQSFVYTIDQTLRIDHTNNCLMAKKSISMARGRRKKNNPFPIVKLPTSSIYTIDYGLLQ